MTRQRREHVLSVRLTKDEFEQVEAEAATAQVTPSEWVRRVLAREAKLLAEVRQLRSVHAFASGVSVGTDAKITIVGDQPWGIR